MEQFQAEIINLVVLILTTCVGLATKSLMAYLRKKGVIAQLDTNKKTVNIVVNAIEQLYKEYDGEEKLRLAKIEMIRLLEDKKIKINMADLDLLIESAVREMKKETATQPETVVHNINVGAPTTEGKSLASSIKDMSKNYDIDKY